MSRIFDPSLEVVAAAQLLREMHIKVGYDYGQMKYVVNAWRFNGDEIIKLAEEKLQDWNPVSSGPRCFDCQHAVDYMDVDDNGVCTCGFCWAIGYEEQFNRGFLIPKPTRNLCWD